MLLMFFSSCAERPQEIAVIPRTTSTTLWEAEHAGAEYAARKYRLQIRWNAPTREDDVQQQISMVDHVVHRKCRGLILAPDQPLALMVPVQRAIAAGIPTVVIVSELLLPPQANLAYVINDDELTGRMGAQRIAKILNGHGRIAIVGIDPQAPSSLSIIRSFTAELEQHSPEISVVDRSVGADSDLDSEATVNQVILSHPEINAIFSLNSLGTTGAYLALKAHSLTGQVKVVGVQQSTELAAALRAHQIDSLIAINTYQMGILGIELLVHPSSFPSHVIKLSPFLVTSQNVDAPESRTFITNDWRSGLQ
jgi:ribose transport system substrate-binding protein